MEVFEESVADLVNVLVEEEEKGKRMQQFQMLNNSLFCCCFFNACVFLPEQSIMLFFIFARMF